MKYFGLVKEVGVDVDTIHVLPDSSLATALKETQGKGAVFVDFYADWCGPCKRISPVFDSLSKVHHENDRFVKVDVDAEKEIASKFGVTSLPTFLALRCNADGKLEVLETVTGANRPALEGMVKKFSFNN